jgi:hypothetical protein
MSTSRYYGKSRLASEGFMQIIPCCSQGMHSRVAMEQESKVCHVCLENIDFEDLFEVSTHPQPNILHYGIGIGLYKSVGNTSTSKLDKAMKIKLASTFAHEIMYSYEHKGIL